MSEKKSYIVYIEETNYGYVEVKAESPQKAKKLAEEQCMDGNVYWGDSDYDITSIEEA